MPRRTLLIVAAAAFAIRIFPFFLSGGPMATPADYDAAVYFSAAALLFRGVMPYRDFVFVHPPAGLYLIGMTSFVGDPTHAFVAARILIALIGGANTYLVGRVVGSRGGVIAAILYATHPDAVLAERAPLLEPVLNLVCLIGAYSWLKREKEGGWFGAAAAVKVLGGIWFLAALASLPPAPRRRGTLWRLIAFAFVTGLLLVALTAIWEPLAYGNQTLLFHSWRPPDGMIARSERMRAMFGGANLIVTILAVIAIVSMFRGPVSREKRFFSVATILTAIAFLTASSYWPQYNAYLAASECALAGLGAEVLLRKRAVGVVIVVLQLIAVRDLVPKSLERSFDVVAVGNAIRAVVPPDATLFTFDPLWSLAGGRIPRVIDTYGASLIDAGKGKFASVDDAFHSPAAQHELRRQLEASRFVVLGWRGNRQLSDETRAWFETHFQCRAPAPGSLCVWERSDRETAAYGEGWYDPEGTPQAVWRWMGAKSVTTLPHVGPRSHLDISYYLPLDALPATPAITIEIDGRVIARIESRSSDITHSYDVDTPIAAPHTLIITTDRVVNPKKANLSEDTRDLGLRLNWLKWTAAGAGDSMLLPR